MFSYADFYFRNKKESPEMGISGLIPAIKNIIRKKKIRHYEGERIGIDGHVWIHRAITIDAENIYHGRESKRFLGYFAGKLRELLSSGVTPVFVFDGDLIPSKLNTSLKRRKTREDGKKEAEFYLKIGNISKARVSMRKAIGITDAIFASVVGFLVDKGIEYIISPYESDAQLHYLESIKYIDAVMTEDSDLILYNTQKILYKYSEGNVEEYNAEDLPKSKDKFFSDNILDIGILSGCDYLESIKGVGLAIAYKKLKEWKTVECFLANMALLGKEIPTGYLEKFYDARRTFLHHIVYDPIKEKRMYLNEPEEKYEFLGTLEETKYMVCNRLTVPVEMKTHYIPQICITPLSLPSTGRTEDEDVEIVSPYFSQ